MRCAKCGAENPAGKRFCGACGVALSNRCARCGTENPPEKKFCARRSESAAIFPARTRRPNSFGWSCARCRRVSATGNLAGPERDTAVVRAEELCEQVGDKERMVDALLALSNVRHQRAEYQSARALVAQALALGEGVDDPRLVARARFHMGENFYWLGDFPASREHCEKALELFGSGPYRNFWQAENVRWSRFYAIVDTAL